MLICTVPYAQCAAFLGGWQIKTIRRSGMIVPDLELQYV